MVYILVFGLLVISYYTGLESCCVTVCKVSSSLGLFAAYVLKVAFTDVVSNAGRVESLEHYGRS